MKISVSTLALYPKPLDEILSCLEDKGVKYCEIINEYPYDAINHDTLDSYNIEISVHAPLSDINIASHNEAIRQSSVSQIKNSIDIASEMKSKVVVVHPGSMPILGDKFQEKILKYNLDSLRECSEHADDCGVRMCVENMPDIKGLFGKDLNELEEIVNNINAYMTLDVGHANNMGVSVKDMLKSKFIKHIHLSDNDGSFDNHNALGSANIDFKTFFKELNSIKYDGILVVEVKHPHEIIESLDYLKTYITDF
jgi:sugar phosphate isomerase/epimerase